MAPRHLAELSWTGLRDQTRPETVAILPTGAIEAHGPHLPLNTDVIIAEAMAREGAARLESAGRPALILPTIAYTSAGFAASFPGTVSLAPNAVTETILEVAGAIARAGIRTLAIANAHFDPLHLGSLRSAVDRLPDHAPSIAVVYPDLTRRPWALRLGDEFISGACHAGCYEGSVVLAERPDLVDENVRTSLTAVPISLSDAIRAGKTSFAAAGGADAYFGDPAAASAEEGRATIVTIGQILCEAVVQHTAEETSP